MTQPVPVTMRQSQRTWSHQNISRKRYFEPLANTADAKAVVQLFHAVLLVLALSHGKHLAQQSEKIFRGRLLKFLYEQFIPHDIGLSVRKMTAISLPDRSKTTNLYFNTPIVDNFYREYENDPLLLDPKTGLSGSISRVSSRIFLKPCRCVLLSTIISVRRGLLMRGAI